MSTHGRSPLNLFFTISLLISMSVGFLTPVSANSNNYTASIELAPTTGTPLIHDISTNEADYPDSKVPRYEKLEITFQIDTEAKNLQMPYDPKVIHPDSPYYIPGLGDIATTGISVDAEFTSPQGNTYLIPSFYYQEFLHEVKEGKDWVYPTGGYAWKVRFAPDEAGVWSYQLKAHDHNGELSTALHNVEVVPSTNHGFIRVSQDPRYFQFEDGSYFSGLGYNFNDLKDPPRVLDRMHDPEQFLADNGSNNIQLGRIWLSAWSIFGASWNLWRMEPDRPVQGGYLPETGLVPFDTHNGKYDYRLRLHLPINQYFVSCYRTGDDRELQAVKPSTKYRVDVAYQSYEISGVQGSSAGFVVKIGGNCSSSGNEVTPYAMQNTGDTPTLLSGYWTSGSSAYFLPTLHLVLQNVSKGDVYVDHVSVREDLTPNDPNDDNFGPNIISKPDMDHQLYFQQRNSFAFDNLLESAKANDVYLKIVTLEKDDRILNAINEMGMPQDPLSKDNTMFYAGQDTKVRWLQMAWWRYLQARWGYSTNIHSWELLNEGAPAYQHYYAGNAFGKFMHQFLPNAHLVTTSIYGSEGDSGIVFPVDFWKNYNMDYADFHEYIDYCGALRDDPAANHEYYDLQYGSVPSIVNKPVMRGEVGWLDWQECDSGVDKFASNTSAGDWLHDLIWSNTHPTGLLESYWSGVPTQEHVYSRANSYDYRPEFKAYYNFIKDIPLNNGRYVDAQATTSAPELRAWGQKDINAGRAHLWIQNINHTWRNVTNGSTIASVSGTVAVTGFQPMGSYVIERWNTHANIKQIEEKIVVAADAGGKISIDVARITNDFAVKIYPSTEPYKMVAKVQGPTPLTVDFIESIEPLDKDPNTFVLAVPNIGRECGGGTPLSIWKVTVDPETQQAISITHKQKLDKIQIVRGTLFEASDGTLFTGGGWCGYKPPYFSTDGGESWLSADAGAVHPEHSTFSYAEFQGQIYAGTDSSPDQGTVFRWLGNGNWEKVLALPTYERSVVTSMVVYHNQLFVGAGFHTSSPRVAEPVYLSTDGNTFEPTVGIPTTHHPRKLFIVGNRLLASVQGPTGESEEYMYLWNANTRTWEQIADYSGRWQWTYFGGSPNIVSYGKSIYAYGHVSTDPEWGIYRSDDLGVSWQQLFPFGTRLIPAMTVAGNRLYFSTEADTNGVAYLYQFELPMLEKAQIVLTKDALPDGLRNFHYFGPWDEFYLDDPGEDDGDTVRNSQRYTDVTALGTYTFSEEKVANWFMEDITCNPPESTQVHKLYRSITIWPNPGETVTCNFTNKYASSLSVHPYWDMDQDGQHDPTEDWQEGWWTEFYDSSGTLRASNFTQDGGHWDLYNIRPGTYTVCQKPQTGWFNTQPILTDPAHNNWPCYTFELSYAQQAKLYFGYSDQPFVAAVTTQYAQAGIEIITVSDLEQDALATWEEFLAVHPGDRLPDEDEVENGVYLPLIAR